jgi:glucan 1,3-beta-glucosidase
VLAPLAGAAALTTKTSVPAFTEVLGRRAERAIEPLALAVGGLVIAITVLAIQAALGLVFDPRYRDFPFTALTGAVVPFLVMVRSPLRFKAIGPSAESVAAATLGLSALFILFNETSSNWQAVWFCGALAALALILVEVRVRPVT